MLKAMRWLAVGVAVISMLAGCADHQGEVGNKNIRPNAVRQDGNGNRVLDKRFADDQMNEANRVNKHRLNSNNLVGAHQNYQIEMSEVMAQKITAMDEVEAAFVVLGDYNAYVAVQLQNNNNINQQRQQSQQSQQGRTGASNEVTADLKQKIANLVKQNSRSIQNVYVSANPDFVGRMTNYWNELQNGNPIQGLIAEFNATVERIFPIELE